MEARKSTHKKKGPSSFSLLSKKALFLDECKKVELKVWRRTHLLLLHLFKKSKSQSSRA
jgi:hypothetical protein